MAEVSLWKDGDRVELAPGATAELELALPEALAGQYNVGDTIPAWWLDTEAGYWREEGLGVIAPSSADASKLAWFADVAHFTWWNCDIPWTNRRCFDVHVVDATGAPVSGVPVRADGTTYSGTSTITSTAADGHACADIVLGKEAEIVLGPANIPLSRRSP